MSPELLTTEDYQNILRARIGNNFTKFIEAKLTSLSENVEGFMGEHYKLQITYEENQQKGVMNFFVKTKPRNNLVQRKIAEETGMYKLEFFVHNVLLPEFEKYGLDTSFAPKCWYSVKEETLVMEDMSTQGYVLPVRGKSFSWEQIKCGLTSLALLHGAGIMYEEIKSKELGRRYVLEEEYSSIFREMYYTFHSKIRSKSCEDWINITVQLFLQMIDFLPESQEWKEEFKKRLSQRDMGKIFVDKTGMKRTFTHGDLWSSNMVFKFEDDTPTKCCLLDYQMVRCFYPAYDVVLFLYNVTTAESHKSDHPILCQFYYDTLSKILFDRGFNILDIYPHEEFQKSMELVEYEAKLQAYSVRAFVNLPKKMLNDGVASKEDGFSKLLFDDRIAYSLKMFQNDEPYRTLVKGDLYSLHDCLFKN